MNAIKGMRFWEWIVLAVSIGCVVYAFGCLHGCSGVRSAVEPLETHATQLGLGTGIGGGAGLLMGATGWGVVVAALVGASVAIFSTPDCSGRGVPVPPPHPLYSLTQLIVWAVVLYFLWLRREWIIRAIKGPSRVQAILHALVAGAKTRPKG